MTNRGSMLHAGEFLQPNEYLTSPNQGFFAMIQDDGNLCIYIGNGPSANKGLFWASDSSRKRGACFLQLQTDGNLCIYSGVDPHTAMELIWSSSNTARPLRNYYLVLQNDGNLCVYSPKNSEETKGNELVWHSGNNASMPDFKIQSITYDLEKVKMGGTNRVDLYEKSDIKGPWSVSPFKAHGMYTSSVKWSNPAGIYPTGPLSMTAIPMIRDKAIELEPTARSLYKWNGETVEARGYDMVSDEFINVMKDYLAQIRVKGNVLHFEVPYTLTGELTLRIAQKHGNSKDVTIAVQYEGTFYGNGLWDAVEAGFSQVDTTTGKADKIRTIPMKFTAS